MKYSLDAVTAEQPIAKLYHDTIGLLFDEPGDDAFGDGRKVRQSHRRRQATIEETQSLDRAVILHVERVAKASDAREFCRRDAHARARQVLDDLGRGVGLPRIHACACHQYERRRHVNRVAGGDCALGDINYLPLAHGHSYHLDFDGVVEAVMMAEALTYQAAEVEQVQSVARLDARGHVPYESFERAAIAEHARDDVA